jgi:hypothetical protein
VIEALGTWARRIKSGTLEVTEVRIHQEPKQEDGVWVQMPRYSFENGKAKQIP